MRWPLGGPVPVRQKQPIPKKLSAYECGFNAFDDARMQFDVRFYLSQSCSSSRPRVSFLFPWAVSFRQPRLFDSGP